MEIKIQSFLSPPQNSTSPSIDTWLASSLGPLESSTAVPVKVFAQGAPSFLWHHSLGVASLGPMVDVCSSS